MLGLAGLTAHCQAPVCMRQHDRMPSVKADVPGFGLRAVSTEVEEPSRCSPCRAVRVLAVDWGPLWGKQNGVDMRERKAGRAIVKVLKVLASVRRGAGFLDRLQTVGHRSALTYNLATVYLPISLLHVKRKSLG